VTEAPRTPPAPAEADPGGTRWVVLLLVFTTLIATSVFGTRPLISYIALSIGAGPAELGLVASSFAVLAIVGAIPLGRSIDRIGERPIMIGGAMLCVAVCSVLPLVRSLPGLAVGHALLGLGQMMAVVGAHTMLAHRGPASKRAFRIGLYTSAASLGHAIGPAWVGVTIGEQVTPEGSTLALFGGAAAAAVAAVSIALTRPEPATVTTHKAQADDRRAGVVETLRLPGMVPALTAGIVALTAVDLLVAYLPAYGEERGITPQTIGLMLAVLALSQMVSRLALGKLLNRFGHAVTLVASVLLAGIVIPVLLAPLGEPGLFAVMTIAGLGLGLAQPLTLVWVALATPPGSRGLAMGVRMGGNRLGQLLIPVAVGATAGQLGVGAIFVTVAALLAGAAGYVIRERRMLTAEMATAGVRPATSSAEP
jgi:MFS family permease